MLQCLFVAFPPQRKSKVCGKTDHTIGKERPSRNSIFAIYGYGKRCLPPLNIQTILIFSSFFGFLPPVPALVLLIFYRREYIQKRQYIPVLPLVSFSFLGQIPCTAKHYLALKPAYCVPTGFCLPRRYCTAV